MNRPRTFRPDFGVEGPYPDPLVVPWWAVLTAVFAVCVALGFIARAAGYL